MRLPSSSQNKRTWTALPTVFVALSVCGQITLSVNPSDYNGYNVTCFGSADGSIDLTVSGGTAPYTYTWSTGANTQDVSDLRAGYISVVVRDANANNARAELTLTEPPELRVDAVPYVYGTGYHVSCFNCYNGSVAVTASDGVPPYTYLWSDGATTEDRTQLDAGSYEVYVTDANGCLQKSGGLVLTQPERDDWTKSGNAGTVPGTHYIGTSDNKDVVFKSNGQEALRLKSNGDVKLSGSLNNFGLLFRDQDGIIRSGTFPNLPPMGNSLCKSISGFPPYWTTLGNDFTLLCPEESPVIGTLDARSLDFVTAGVQRMQIDSAGKVGIGTEPNPVGDYRLFVEGGIATRDVLVKHGAWPDYVFDESYRLMPLPRLRTYLNDHHHLPGMCSAGELNEQGGVELGEHARQVTRIVEEQALYILQLEERLTLLEERMAAKETSQPKP